MWPVVYAKDWEWNGFKVVAGRLGWLVNYWSREQGVPTGWQKRVSFELIPRTRDLASMFNDICTWGEFAAFYCDGKVTKKGTIVQ